MNHRIVGWFMTLSMVPGVAATAQPSEPDDVLYGRIVTAEDTTFARYELRWPDGSLDIAYAPYGRAPASLAELRLTPDQARLTFRWSDGAVCELERSPEEGWSYEGLVDIQWAGRCVPGTGAPWQITVGMSGEPDWGQNLPASDDDVRIIDRALELLEPAGSWNRHDDRVCEDDERIGSRSLFCALYRASFDVAGEYLHARRAMDLVRLSVRESTGRSYVHTLRDYNNHPERTVDEIRERLREGRTKVLREITNPFRGGRE